MDNKSIKKNIQHRRRETPKTQEDMAKFLGIKRNAYRQIETGKTKLLGGHLEEIAEALEVSVEELVLGYKPLSPEETKELKEKAQSYEVKVKQDEASHEAKVKELNEKLTKSDAALALAMDNIKMKDESIERLKRENQELQEKLSNFAESEGKDDAKGNQTEELPE